MHDFKKIRSRLLDKQSEDIYDGRLAFSLTGEQKHIWRMLWQIDCIGSMQSLLTRLNRDSGKKLVIFGAGYNGTFVRDCLAEYNWTAFLDNKVDTVKETPLVSNQSSPLLHGGGGIYQFLTPDFMFSKMA